MYHIICKNAFTGRKKDLYFCMETKDRILFDWIFHHRNWGWSECIAIFYLHNFLFFFWFYFETKHLTLKYVLNSDRCNKNRNGKCFFWFLFIWLSSDIFHCVMEWINWCYTFWLWHFYVYLFCLLSFVFSFYELRNIYNVEWKIDWNNKNVV